MRSMEMSAKTVEAAVQAACEALGVDRDDINVSYEVLEFPTRKLFKTIPAKVLVKVEEPEAEKPAEVSTKPAEVVEISDETAPEIQKEVVEDMVEEAELAPVPGEEVEVPLDIDADPRLQAAVDYLTPIFNLMGVENFTFTAVKKGAATVLKVSGEHMGALIGRRGETMESLSYLASLVVNRMEGPYVKLGLDVGGYRNKREDDLSALARRIADRVIRTGCYYEMEPMNPLRAPHHPHGPSPRSTVCAARARATARPAMWCCTPPTPMPATCPTATTPATSAADAVTVAAVPAVTTVADAAPAARVRAAEAPATAVLPAATTAAAPATAARAPACPPASLRMPRATPQPSRWHPRPPSASTTVTISPSVRSSFKQQC